MHESLQDRNTFMKRLGGVAVEIIGPALIMLIVGSLAFFLIEIFYRGPFDGRMKWVFGLFVFAAVLISRISIDIGAERAYAYGFILAVAVLLVANRFMQSDTIFGLGGFFGNVLLLVVIWWCSARLTWDCTFIDHTRDATGQGMLDLAVDRVNRFRNSEDVDEVAPQANKDESDIPKRKPVVDLLFKRRQPNTPGLWVFYFLLAGLPIFGLGQMFLGMSNTQGHYNASIDFAIYMFGTLCLLMMTSITGLHRYLENRSSAMPSKVAKRWLIFGTCLALAIIVVTFLLPRPTPRYAISSWLPRLTSPDLQPSDVSFGKDGQASGNNSNINVGPRSSHPNKGQGNQGGSSNGQSDQSTGNSSSGSGSQNDPNSQNTREGDSGSGGNHKEGSKDSSGSSSSSGGKQSGKSEGSQDSNQQHQGNQGSQEENNSGGQNENDAEGSSNSENDPSGSQDSGEPKAESQLSQGQNNRTRGPQENQPGTGSNSPANAPGENMNQREQSESTGQQYGREGGAASSAPRNQPNSPLTEVGRLFKFLFFLIVAAVLLYFAYRYRSQLLPSIKSFLAELAEFWRKLWERKPKAAEVEELEEPNRTKRPHVGFSHYQDPFANGKAEKWEVAQLVKYTFAAMEAWARDHRCPRDEDQTPHEFAKELGQAHKSMKQPAIYLADLYCELAYSDHNVSRSAAMKLADIWKKMAAIQPNQLAVVGMA